MTLPHDFDRTLAAWLDERAHPTAPPGLLDTVVAQSTRVRPRPAWRIRERWIPMPLTLRLAVVPRVVLLLILALILALALAAGAVVGGRLPLLRATALAPTGPAENGLVAWDAGGDIWVANPDGTDPHAITSGPNVDISPAFSPDGTHLAYWSLVNLSGSLVNTSGSPVTAELASTLITASTAALTVVDSTGQSPVTLATGVHLDYLGLPASWAPDSRSLVYADRGATMTIVSLDAPKRVLPQRGVSPTWSPDGSSIAYRGTDGVLGVWVMGADGIGARKVSSTLGSGFAYESPQWSPDGQRIAFFAGPDYGHAIWVVNTDGADQYAVSAHSDEYWPYWSPDGRRIAFEQVGISDIIADPDGGNRVVLAVAPLASFSGSAPTTWSPDGSAVLAFLSEANGDLRPGVVLLDATGDPTRTVNIPTDTLWNSGSWQRVAN